MVAEGHTRRSIPILYSWAQRCRRSTRMRVRGESPQQGTAISGKEQLAPRCKQPDSNINARAGAE